MKTADKNLSEKYSNHRKRGCFATCTSLVATSQMKQCIENLQKVILHDNTGITASMNNINLKSFGRALELPITKNFGLS